MVLREEIYISVSRWKMGLIWPSNNRRKKSYSLCMHGRFLRNDNSALSIPQDAHGKGDGKKAAPRQSEVTAGALQGTRRAGQGKALPAACVRWGL